MKAVYAFSGDPITFGHIDIIERSLKVFDHVTIAIGSNPDKKYLFTLQERTDMAEKVLSKFGDKVDVKSFSGLLIDFLKENCISIVIRGIRSNMDFEYEKTLSDINKTQDLKIDTWFLTSNQSLEMVSSSAVKELTKHLGDVSKYVPIYIKSKLEEKILNAKIIGITGEIGAGKSYLADLYVKTCSESRHSMYNFFNIDVDRIGREVLTTYTQPIYYNVRMRLCEELFSTQFILSDIITDSENMFIDPKKIGVIFSNKKLLKEYNEITRDTIIFKLRENIINIYKPALNYNSMHQLPSIIFVNSALIIEGDILSLVNNNVIFIKADYEVRHKRLIDRGYSEKEIQHRMTSQLGIEDKLLSYNKSIKNNGGHLCIIDNSGSESYVVLNEINTYLKEMEH